MIESARGEQMELKTEWEEKYGITRLDLESLQASYPHVV